MRIQQAIARLNLSAAVDTAVITKAKFRQSEELAKKVNALVINVFSYFANVGELAPHRSLLAIDEVFF